jgi:hypothetical protein
MRWPPAVTLGIFLAGVVVGVGVMALVQQRPSLPRQYQIAGTVSAVTASGKGFAIRTSDGRVLGYELDYSTEGADLIEEGREVRLTVLAGDGITEIVARVEPGGASGSG